MSRLRWLLGSLLLLLAAVPARAQYVYGVTALQLDTEFDQAYGYSATALDYYACYYYDAAVAGTLYEGTTAIDGSFYHGMCTAEVYTYGATHENVLYTQYSEHYLIAYYYYYYYGGYYDPWGFFGFAGGDYGGGFNHYGCYCPAFFAQSSQDIGSTQVTLLNPGEAAPKLDGPSSVTRGDRATFRILNVPTAGTTVDWSFSEGGPATVTYSGGTTWDGVMATSGTVRATVHRGSNPPVQLGPKSITVNPRNNFGFTAKTAAEQPNGPDPFVCEGRNGKTLRVPDPPTGRENEDAFGQFSACMRFSFDYPLGGVASGPNQGYWLVTAARDSSSSSEVKPQNSTFAWTITPQLKDPNSELYRAQCGRDGFISGEQLKANTTAHEIGGTKSHHSHYVAAQNNATYNVGVGLEQVVGVPTLTEAQFVKKVNDEGELRIDRIVAAAKVEPCADVSMDSTANCVSRGRINYPPYTPCSPLDLRVQGVSSTQIDFRWTDGSFNETGFRIEQRENNSPTWYSVGSEPAGATTHSATQHFAPSKIYWYRVVAITADDGRFSAPSNEVQVTVPAPPGSQPPPAQPGYLGGGAAAGQIQLGWTDDSSDEDGFKVERSTSGGPFAEIASVGAGVTWYADAAIDYSTTYTYQVRAWNAGGASNPSPPVTVTSLAPGSPPAAPGSLWGYAYYGGLTLNWSDLSHDEDYFVVERNDGWGYSYDVGWIGANTTTYTDYGLQSGQTYVYRIRAENAWGASYSGDFYYYQPYWWEQ